MIDIDYCNCFGKHAEGWLVEYLSAVHQIIVIEIDLYVVGVAVYVYLLLIRIWILNCSDIEHSRCGSLGWHCKYKLIQFLVDP